MLKTNVPSGRGTTYAEVSNSAYGKHNLNHLVRPLLRGAANHGHLALTNRVVATSGGLANLLEGRKQQHEQLKTKGVPLSSAGTVVFSRINPVVLKNHGDDRT